MGYYEVMKTTFNRQLPPPKAFRIKSIRISSIAGKTHQIIRVIYQLGNFIPYISLYACIYLGVGKGDGSDFKVKIIVRKELVFQCTCAKQQNCKVGDTHSSGHSDSFIEWET